MYRIKLSAKCIDVKYLEIILDNINNDNTNNYFYNNSSNLNRQLDVIYNDANNYYNMLLKKMIKKDRTKYDYKYTYKYIEKFYKTFRNLLYEMHHNDDISKLSLFNELIKDDEFYNILYNKMCILLFTIIQKSELEKKNNLLLK